MATKPNFLSNLLPAIENFSPGQAILSGIPGGQQINNVLQKTGHSLPTIGDIGQNYSNLNKQLGSKDPKEQFNAMVGSGGLAMGDLDVNPGISAELPQIQNANPKEYSGENTWSQYIKSPNKKAGDYSSIIKNPNYKAGSANPASYAQDTQAADSFTSTPGDNIAPNPTPQEGTIVNTKIPDQPALTTQQQKAFTKTGLDKYQLPSSYGDKRSTLEKIDKSVIANVVGGNSPEEVLQRLPTAEQNVWSQITDKANQISAIDVHKDIMPHINDRLESLVNKGIINDAQYQELSKNLAANIGAKATDKLAPTAMIQGKDLIDLQTGANAKAPNSIPSGSNQIPYINKAIADGYRDAIGNADPNIRYLYRQYASMKRIGEMSTTFRNTAGQAPTILERLKQNPALTLGAGALALPEIIGAGKAALPAIESVGGAIAGSIKPAENALAGAFGYFPQTNADNTNKNPQGQYSHMANSIPQDVNGHYNLPDNPGVSPLTPGTPEYTRASAALPGGARQFMVNAPQTMASANSVQDDIKSGMPLDILSKFKTSQDIQAYMSNPSSPYAQQLAHVADLNNKYLSEYQAIYGAKPDASQFINPGDSKEQFGEKYNEIVNFVYNNYKQFQVPYLQTTEAPTSYGNGGGAVQYNSAPPSQGAAGMMQQNFPVVPPISNTLPPIQ